MKVKSFCEKPLQTSQTAVKTFKTKKKKTKKKKNSKCATKDTPKKSNIII